MKNSRDTIINFVLNKLHATPDHCLSTRCTEPYYTDFFTYVEEMIASGNLTNAQSLCRKLRIGGEYDRNIYLQGVSEIVLQFFATHARLTYSVDKKLKSASDGYDVDLQIIDKGFTYNLEIKTPTISNTPTDQLNAEILFRSTDKETAQKEMQALQNDFLHSIIKNSQGKYNTSQFKKNNDTKVLTYLESCQKKFVFSTPKSINVLILSVPTQEMLSYWTYLYNGYTGIFTPAFEGSYYHKDKQPFLASEINATDVIYLTNIPSGHLRSNPAIKPWDLRTYCSLLCINPHSPKTRRLTDRPIYTNLYCLLPNCTNEFERGYETISTHDPCKHLIESTLFVAGFIENRFPYSDKLEIL